MSTRHRLNYSSVENRATFHQSSTTFNYTLCIEILNLRFNIYRYYSHMCIKTYVETKGEVIAFIITYYFRDAILLNINFKCVCEQKELKSEFCHI